MTKPKKSRKLLSERVLRCSIKHLYKMRIPIMLIHLFFSHLFDSVEQWHLLFPTMLLMFSLLSSSLVMMTKWWQCLFFSKGPFRISIYQRECQNLYSASPTHHVLAVFSIRSLLIECFHTCLNKHKRPLILWMHVNRANPSPCISPQLWIFYFSSKSPLRVKRSFKHIQYVRFSSFFLLRCFNAVHCDVWNKIQMISPYGCTLKGKMQFSINLVYGSCIKFWEKQVDPSQAVYNNAWVKSWIHRRNLYSATRSTLRFVRHVRQKRCCVSPFKAFLKHYWSQLQKQLGSTWGENTTIKHRFAFSDQPFNVTTSL